MSVMEPVSNFRYSEIERLLAAKFGDAVKMTKGDKGTLVFSTVGYLKSGISQPIFDLFSKVSKADDVEIALKPTFAIVAYMESNAFYDAMKRELDKVKDRIQIS